MSKNTKSKFYGIVEQNGREIHRSETLPITEAMRWATDHAEVMRRVGKGEWSVYLQCAILEQNDEA